MSYGFFSFKVLQKGRCDTDFLLYELW